MGGYSPVAMRPSGELVTRPRLLAVLGDRFQRRLILMAVGPGSGKSTLLAQAMAENRLDPRGTDVPIACTPEDSAATRLAERLLTALSAHGGARRRADSVRAICAGVRRLAPAEVALLLDDVHLLPPGSSGARLLDDLLRELPLNAHLVLAGRREPSVAWARLAAAGQVTEVREPDLAFTEEELRQFARLRGVAPSSLSGLGGWPALTELAATAGRERVMDFLWQEVLAPLPVWTRKLLAAVAAVGGADEEVAGVLSGRPVTLGSLLAGLPLINRSNHGWYEVDALWRRALASQLTPAEMDRARRAAAHVLSRRGDIIAAVRLCIEAGAWDDADRLIVESCRVAQVAVDSDTLEEWLRRLPPERRAGPTGRLLEGILLRATDAGAARAMLLRAGEAYQAAGHPAGMTAAIAHAAVTAWWIGDLEPVARVLSRLVRFPSTPVEADARESLAGLAWFVQLLRADLRGDLSAATVALERSAVSGLATPWRPVFDCWRGLTYLAVGVPGRALALAERPVAAPAVTGRWHSSAVTLLSLQLLGRQEDAVRRLPEILRTHPCAPENRAAAHALASSVLAWAGRPEQARSHLGQAGTPDHAGTPDRASSAPLLDLLLAGARLAVALASGDEQVVPLAARLNELRDRGQGGAGGAGGGTAAQVIDRWFLAVQYVLLPSARRWWDEQPLPGCFAVARDLARTVLALRRGEPVDRSRLPEPGVIRAFLPQAWAAELTGPCRDGAAPAAAGAPSWGQAPLHIRVLGQVQLVRGETSVADRRLRRRRVRELLAYLVIYRQATRERVAADMWPDHEPVAAARNLRVTLTYLGQLLQPDRSAGPSSAPLLRTRHRIELVESPQLTTDVWIVERLLDQAVQAERQHAPSVALTCYREALGHYAGNLLAEASGPEWLLAHRERLQRRVAAVAVRAGELLLADGAVGEALRLAEQALTTDPWSEPAYQLLVSVHLTAGNRTAARLALQDCHRMLAALDTVPDARTRMLARGAAARPAQENLRLTGVRHR